VELVFAVLETFQAGGVDDPDEEVGFFEVVSPERAQAFLAAHVPDVELVSTTQHGISILS
jgi:hypothetical protein